LLKLKFLAQNRSRDGSSSHAAQQADEDFFLPDLCNIRAVFLAVIITQLLAFTLTLADSAGYNDFWPRLGVVSMFSQWVALTGTAVLCATRKQLMKLPLAWSAGVCLSLLAASALAISEICYRILAYSAQELIMDSHHAYFLFRSVGITTIFGAMGLRYIYVQHQWRRNVHDEAELRIQALQARIRPHFLFNSMNTIAAMIRGQPALAEQAVEDLADLFRFSLADSRNQVRLHEEMDLCRQYARIESLRLGKRLHIEWDLDKVPMDAMVPGLCVQPLLENAIYHGIEGLPDGGTINIHGTMENQMITITIKNPLPKARPNPRKGNQMALENTRQRLRLAYGDLGKLDKENDSEFYRVYLQFPYRSTTSAQ